MYACYFSVCTQTYPLVCSSDKGCVSTGLSVLLVEPRSEERPQWTEQEQGQRTGSERKGKNWQWFEGEKRTVLRFCAGGMYFEKARGKNPQMSVQCRERATM